MTMQHNIDIFRRDIRRNMDEPKLQPFAFEVDNQRPVVVPITIAAHDCQRRTDRLQVKRDCRLANISQMPDLVRVAGKIDNFAWQLVMSIRDYEHAHCFQQSAP